MNTVANSRGRPWRAFLILTLCLLGGALPLAAQDESLESLDELISPPAPAQAPGSPTPAPTAPGAAGASELEELQGGGLEGLESPPPARAPATPGPAPAAAPAAEEARALKLTLNGYVKPLAVWETRSAPSDLPVEDLNRFTTVGARTQVRAQGVIKDRAQFFTAVNFDFNEVDRGTDTTSTTSEKGELRMVESYIDLFGESTRWRVGSQLVTWGFMDGFEVPVDRFNARDTGYKSVELEDLKLAETGVEFSWSIGKQRMDWFYVPVSKVNRLPPDFERAFIQSSVNGQDPVKGTDVVSNNGKYAVQFSGTLSPVDYQLNYVDTLDPRTNLGVVDYGDGAPGAPYYKVIRRTRSPGLDLQLDLGSALARFSAVYFNTSDIGNDDPLIQNDWYQVMVGAEFWVGSALMQINAGRKEVVDYNKGIPSSEESATFTNNLFLGQPAESTNIVVGSFNDTYLPGAALEFSLLLAYLWNDETGELVAFRVRPYFAYNLADGVAVTLMPSFSNEVSIETYEVYTELKFSF